MIRLLVILIVILLFFLLSLPIYLILWLVGLGGHKERRDKMALFFVRGIFRLILWIAGTKITVMGKERLPENQACLYVGNHSGFFDILTGYTRLPGRIGFVSKVEIKKVPFLNWWMYFVNCLFFDRKNMKDAVRMISDGTKKLKEGISIFIFPEGTRSKDGKVHEFKEGSLRMGVKAKTPIVPIAIHGTNRVFEDHFPWIRPAKVTMEIGTPLYPADFSKEDQKHMGAMAREQIITMLEGQGLEVRPKES